MRSQLRILTAASVALVAGYAPCQDSRRVVPEGANEGSSFSPGIVSGDFVYLSGSLGRNPATGEMPAGIEAQVRQTMENLGTVLEAAGADFSRVVRTNVFLTDARNFPAMNEVYRSFFSDAPPSRATVEADLVVPGALVEIEMVAALPGVERKVIKPSGLNTPPLPFSWGVEAGNTLFVAGTTSRSPETFAPVEGDIGVQTTQVLENIGQTLNAAELDYGDVVECTVFLADPRDFQGMNEVFRTFFPEAPPTRATVRAKLMNPGFKVEIQCVAVRGGDRQPVYPGGRRGSSPFSPAVAAGDRLYVSGFTGRGPDGYGDVEAQTRQTLARLEGTLAAGGVDFTDVISARVYVTDVRHFAAVNAIYRELVPGPRPIRSTVGTPLMSADALVEIQMVAVRKY